MSVLSDLLSGCACDTEKLNKYIEFTDDEKKELDDIIKRYPVRVTPYYLGLINKEDKNDPIRKLCIPERLEYSEGGLEDTSGEQINTVIRGMQHKYRQTVLVLTTNNCAAYCRHCFRKRMVGSRPDEVAESLSDMAAYVREHPEINNVLLSGGDAFVNENELIRDYLEAFSGIENVRLIRFGTRVPVVLPQRIYEDEELLKILRKYSSKVQLAVITQFDHPREVTDEARRAVHALMECGVYVRNQTVLLKGVNDDPEVMAELANGIVSIGVQPYYIFQCRPVLGVKNQFQVPFNRGEEILKKAKTMMNGQARSYRYVLSHPTGKIEVIGRDGEEMLFKYHEAKADADQGRLFKLKLPDDKCWLSMDDVAYSGK